MTTLTNEGEGIVGKHIIYISRKVSDPKTVMKSGRHRGVQGTL
jgi:hypothetical protein